VSRARERLVCAVIARFEGEAGRRRLVQVFMSQKMVANEAALAEELAGLVDVVEVTNRQMLISQDGSDNDIYLVLAGSFSVVVNGKVMAIRVQNDHVGDIAAIEPALPRSATVVARERSVVCKLTEPALADLAQRYPNVWRNLAKELAHRLFERNKHVKPVREVIRVFIMSSTEALPVAYTVQNHFARDNFIVTPWTNGVFKVSNYRIESLEKMLDDSDFAIAIAQPDDITNIRGEERRTARDNVIFELGMFIGRLTRERTFLLEPRGEEVDLPSDLEGLNTISYRCGDKKDMASLLGSACNQIRDIIIQLGPRN
jgi:CRP/FNR family cyclic AMP-dependent transcriptional regulator